MSNNYTILHCHTMLSNATTTLDSVNSYDDYIKLCKENGMTALSITEHGNILSWYYKKSHIEKEGLKYIHAIEAYITETLDEKIRDNRHCIIIAKNKNGFYKLNELVSKSFNRADVKVLDEKERLYYQPRISLDEFLQLDDDFIITSACVGGILNKKECSNNMYNKVLEYFIKNKHRCYLEIQHHLVNAQKEHNKNLYLLSKEYGLNLIVGTDTHASTEEYAKARILLQKRKKIYFESEEGWDLTFKTYDDLIKLYEQQNVIPMEDIKIALENTNKIANEVESFSLDKSFKYPKLYENPLEIFKTKIKDGLQKKQKYLTDFTDQQIKDRINEELKVYEKTNLIDFMLLQKYIRDWERDNGIYCGVARGSVSGSLIAYLLNITEMNSLKFDLNFFRFANPDRVTLADVDSDYYSKDKEKVDRFILHDKMNLNGIYTCAIITYNTIALKGAIRDAGGGLDIPLEKVDEIAKNIETNEQKYREEYPELFKYVDLLQGVITSIGSHPAGSLITTENIFKNFGTITLSTNNYPVSCINMKEVEELGYLKLDILGLDNVGIINETCKLLNREIITPDNIDLNDDKVWDSMIEDTTCIFQMESDLASKCLKSLFSKESLSKIYKYTPNVSKLKLMSFVNGLIRPGCASFRDDAIQGNFYDNGLKELNEFLGNTLGRVAMQEDIMMFLVKFCNYSMSESDTVRRAIAKKKGTENLLPEIERRFIEHTSEKFNISKDKCKEIIKPFLQTILSASEYAFSWNHSDSYSFIGYACGYLRYYYPLEFLTSCLNIFETQEDIEKVTNYAISHNITIHPIKFGKSASKYMLDKDNNAIYKGVASIKFLNSEVADKLYELSKTKTFVDFPQLYQTIINENIPLNSKQMSILIKLDYFSDFGKSKKLLKYIELYNEFYGKKSIKKEGKDYIIPVSELCMYCEKETDKQYSNFNYELLLKDQWGRIPDKDISLDEKLKTQTEFLGYITYINPELKDVYMVTSFDTPYSRSKPNLSVYNLSNGEITKCKVKDDKYFDSNPFTKDSFIKIDLLEQQWKNRKELYTEGAEGWSKKEINMGYRWVKSDQMEWVLKNWKLIK